MAILKNYPENMDAKIKYDLIRSQKMLKMASAKGKFLNVAAYIIREDIKDGEVVKIVALKTEDGEIYATNSPVFIREFEAVVECNPDSGFTIEVMDGTSRSNRHYVTCAWATDR